VLVCFPGNRWIVVDANHAADGLRNATVELLRGPAEQPGFEIVAIVLTHLHADHYSGLPELLDFCQELASRRGCALDDIVKGLILPRSYDSFIEYIRKVNRPYLEALLTRLEALAAGPLTIESLRYHDFAWRSLANGDLRPGEGWLVTYYPPPEAVTHWLLGGRFPELPPPVKLGSSLITADNRFVYFLGVGYGSGPRDLHVLLTSDIPGEAFSDLTRDLRQRVLPRVQAGQVGAPYSLGQLLRQRPEGSTSHKTDARPRLRPVQCLTVPHHGSGNGPAKAEDLAWWLDKPDEEPKRPAFAMVQGGPRALQKSTIEELFKADLQIFATSKPQSLAESPPGHTGCSVLDDKIMAGGHRPVPTVRTLRVEEPDSPPLSAHLAVHGGTGGIHLVMAQNLYRIVPTAPHWEHYDLATIYDAGPAAGR
jgi:hypothetical protein